MRSCLITGLCETSNIVAGAGDLRSGIMGVVTDIEVAKEAAKEAAKTKVVSFKNRECGSSTERTKNLRDLYMSHVPSICPERSELFTASYQATEAEPHVLRQAKAFAKVLGEAPIWIQEGELIVGNIASRPRGSYLFPEFDQTWLECEYGTIENRDGDPWVLCDEDKVRIRATQDYWRGNNLSSHADAITPDIVKISERSTFALADMGKIGGIGHIAADFEGVLQRGLNNYIEQAQEQWDALDAANPEDYKKMRFLEATIIADKAVIAWANRFADLALEQAEACTDQVRKQELEELADVCRRVPANPAGSYREALQCIEFVFAAVQIESNGVSVGVGRLDQYTLPFYLKDIESGALDEQHALELTECLWIKLGESIRACPEMLTANHSGYPFWVQVTIGGQTQDAYDATNELSYLILQATTNMQLANPTLSARIHKRTPEKFLMKCGEAVRSHAGGLPALFNDDVVIPSQLANVPGITKEDAYDYCVIGCSEIAFGGKGTEGFAYQGWSCGRMLELTMAGTDVFTAKPKTSGVGDILSWKHAEDMMQAFREQVEMVAKALFMQQLPMYEVHGEFTPCPYLSSVTRDCISNGKSYYTGGALYGNGVVNTCIVGIGSLGNSIAAIKKLVFDDKLLTTGQLKHALDTNFMDGTTAPTGAEIQQLCLHAPKYGNDDPYVDNITKDLLNIMVKELRKYKTDVGGRFQATISPVSAHIAYGMMCGATPDGRNMGVPLSEGCSPAQGSDINGPTATVKSVANLEHINLAQGTIFNMRMHPAALANRTGLMKWADLVRTYFDMGGWEIQFNIVDAETLKAAQLTPEEYKNLVVRVVGYSAFFVNLGKPVQDDIISRTEHT